MATHPGQSDVTVKRYPDSTAASVLDVVVAEEPLEIRLNDTPLAVTMRTPGDDLELVAGFLWTEGIISNPDQILGMEHCREDGKQNIVKVQLAEDHRPDMPRLERHFYTNSSCGLCGKVSIESILCKVTPIQSPVVPAPEVMATLGDKMRDAQRLFVGTGSCHAAVWFDSRGQLLCLREDVGRHNTVDKLVGWAVLGDRLPMKETILMVSGRVSFEIMQKAVMAGIPVVVAVGGPTSLAIEAARSFHQTLIGFCRDGRFNIYHQPDTKSDTA